MNLEVRLTSQRTVQALFLLLSSIDCITSGEDGVRGSDPGFNGPVFTQLQTYPFLILLQFELTRLNLQSEY